MTTQQPQAQQPPSVTLTDMKLTDEIKEMINNAFVPAGKPVMFAYVDEEGQPALSFRGSTRAHSDDQLAVWVRNPEGGLMKALGKNNRVSLLYRDPETRARLIFRGKGRIDSNDAVREKLYNEMPERERSADPDKKGMALIIDLDRVDGFMPGFRAQMRRQ